MSDGFLEPVSIEDYHRRPELSSSQMSDFMDDTLCWYHWHAKKDWPRKSPTDVMKRGQITHEIIEIGVQALVGGELDRFVKVIPARVLNADGHAKGSPCINWKKENPARVYLKPHDLNPFKQILLNIHANEITRDMLAADCKEHSYIWTDPDSGVACRARTDLIYHGCIVDWKTAAEITPNRFASEVEKRHYSRRLAFYRRGWQAVTGDAPDIIAVAIRNKPGFGVKPYEIPRSWIDEADEEVSRTLERIANFSIDDELDAPIEVLKKPRWSSYQEPIGVDDA